MFSCRSHPLLKLLLLVLGLKFVTRERWTPEEKEAYRAKRRLFREKMREAFDVWDEPSTSNEASDVKSSTD